VQLDHAGETSAILRIRLAWLGYAMAILMGFTAAALAVLAFRRPRRHFVGDAGP
jgi:hypothetical protein